jgi:hypothetical protein
MSAPSAEVKADESWGALGFEVAAHGVLRHGLQFVERVGLSAG